MAHSPLILTLVVTFLISTLIINHMENYQTPQYISPPFCILKAFPMNLLGSTSKNKIYLLGFSGGKKKVFFIDSRKMKEALAAAPKMQPLPGIFLSPSCLVSVLRKLLLRQTGQSFFLDLFHNCNSHDFLFKNHFTFFLYKI